jgi:hypothetical protein
MNFFWIGGVGEEVQAYGKLRHQMNYNNVDHEPYLAQLWMS